MQLQQNPSNINIADVINSIQRMDFDSIEKVKNSLIDREIYFKTHQKDTIKNVVDDFKNNGYSDEFLNDLEQGLKNSSVYEN